VGKSRYPISLPQSIEIPGRSAQTLTHQLPRKHQHNLHTDMGLL